MMDSKNISDGDKNNRRDEVLCLFDVDGTITPAMQSIDEEMDAFLQTLKTKVSIGLVGGSDMVKIAKQTLPVGLKTNSKTPEEICINRYDYVFAENGLVAYKNGAALAKQSIISHIGEDKLQRFINFCLDYMSKLQLPVKRGNFIEFRNGLINVSPVGRSCNHSEREEFNAFDKIHKIREHFIKQLESRFGPDSNEPIDLVYSIGGQISFDAFPRGWDKTFCLNLIDQPFREIHFFGDKTYKGGNDYEIFIDPRTIGHSVTCPSDTIQQLRSLKL